MGQVQPRLAGLSVRRREELGREPRLVARDVDGAELVTAREHGLQLGQGGVRTKVAQEDPDESDAQLDRLACQPHPLGDGVGDGLGGEARLRADEPRAEAQLEDVEALVVGVEHGLATRTDPVLRTGEGVRREVDPVEVGRQPIEVVVSDQQVARPRRHGQVMALAPGDLQDGAGAQRPLEVSVQLDERTATQAGDPSDTGVSPVPSSSRTAVVISAGASSGGQWPTSGSARTVADG